MTLNETEETLQTLINRHPGLDDSMLVTLLRAGGWEEKEIQVARTLFASYGKPKERITNVAGVQENLPTLPEVEDLPAQIEYDHLLSPGNALQDDAIPLESPVPMTEKVSEPQSLTKETPTSNHPRREELPHDLPLRPFETSDHIWPFSRYKDVFYGEIEPVEVSAPTSAPEVSIPETVKEIPVVVEQKIETPKVAPVFTPPPIPRTSSAPHTGTDDKLVLIACTMLIALLFVLGYMYSNGRL